MSLKDKIIISKLPEHVAIIMDGNGRWAKRRGSERIFGHQQGIKAVRNVVEASGELGIKYLTLFAFSKENWCRPKAEIDALMDLMASTIKAESETLIKNNIRLLITGDLDCMSSAITSELQKVTEATKNNTGLTLVIALSYSSRWEIAEAAAKICKDFNAGKLKEINEEVFARYLVTAGIPDPALLVRTSGEFRISNFLLWQIAYAELYFTEKLWPDFSKEDFYEAIISYQKRERRFGKTGEQCK